MEVCGENYKIPVSIVRGGTSKGIIIEQANIFSEPESRDKIILGIFGSPDKRQIDGLGGADSLTSKLALVSKSNINGVDVNYTFGQVGIENANIDYSLTCGNLVAGVAVFAIDKGMVKITEPITEIIIYNTNTKKRIKVRLRVKDNKFLVEGSYTIDGVPGSGSKIDVEFLRPEGSITGKLFPFDYPSTYFSKNTKKINASIIDSGVLACFVNSSDIGLVGDEGPDDIDNNIKLLNNVKEIKSNILRPMSIAKDEKDLSNKIVNLPKFIFVSKPKDYYSPINGKFIKSTDIDLLARVITSGKLHKAFPITSGIATATAACIPGTIPYDIVNKNIEEKNTIRIGHPSGIMEININIKKANNNWIIERAIVGRTARIIMDGIAYVPLSRIKRNK